MASVLNEMKFVSQKIRGIGNQMVSSYRQRSMKHHSAPSPTPLTTRLGRILASLFIAAIALAACGSAGEPVSAGSGSDDENTPNEITDPADETDDTGEAVPDRDDNGQLEDFEEAIAAGGDDPASDFVQPIDPPQDPETTAEWQRLLSEDAVAPDDILDPKPWAIVEAFAISADATEVIVRYTAGNPPCTQSRTSVIETDTSIEISLEVGLHPNVAAMSCLAGDADTETIVPLKSPVGDRSITAIQP